LGASRQGRIRGSRCTRARTRTRTHAHARTHTRSHENTRTHTHTYTYRSSTDRMYAYAQRIIHTHPLRVAPMKVLGFREPNGNLLPMDVTKWRKISSLECSQLGGQRQVEGLGSLDPKLLGLNTGVSISLLTSFVAWLCFQSHLPSYWADSARK
jgi:hypothetical protein